MFLGSLAAVILVLILVTSSRGTDDGAGSDFDPYDASTEVAQALLVDASLSGDRQVAEAGCSYTGNELGYGHCRYDCTIKVRDLTFQKGVLNWDAEDKTLTVEQSCTYRIWQEQGLGTDSATC